MKSTFIPLAAVVGSGLGALALAMTAGAAPTHVAVAAGKPTEFGYTLSQKKLPVGTVDFVVTNKGSIPHDFKVCASPKGGSANACTGKGTKLISPGRSTTLAVTFKTKGVYEYLCTVAGHAAAGMKGDVTVG